MAKKNDQKLCWNCDGSITLDLSRCPYCAVPLEVIESVSQSEWDQALEKKALPEKEEKNNSKALLLLIPGILLTLFGAILFLFAKEGVLTLSWKESFATIYLIGAAPLLFLGFRALK